MLMRMWGNWNHGAWRVVGMENGAAAVENNMVIPQKFKKTHHLIQQSHC